MFTLIKPVPDDKREAQRVHADEVAVPGDELGEQKQRGQDFEDAGQHGLAELGDLVFERRDVVELEADVHELLVDAPRGPVP